MVANPCRIDSNKLLSSELPSDTRVFGSGGASPLCVRFSICWLTACLISERASVGVSAACLRFGNSSQVATNFWLFPVNEIWYEYRSARVDPLCSRLWGLCVCATSSTSDSTDFLVYPTVSPVLFLSSSNSVV